MSVLTAVTATVSLLLTGSMAGLFFAYSASVMLGLDAVKPEQSVAAMQSINIKIQNPVFLPTFLFAPFVALATGVLLLVADHRAAAIAFLAAAAVYFAGALLPTIVVNVPMNNALDAATPTGAEDAARLWAGYSPRWTRWNHMRTISSVLSMLLVGLGLFLWGRAGA